MNKDTVRSLLNKNIYMKNKEHSLIEKNKKQKRIFNNTNEIIINLDKKDKIKNISEKSNVKYNTNTLFKSKSNSKRDLFYEKKIEETTNRVNMKKITILKKIHLCYIIKSYFYCKGKIIKLIDLCNKFVDKELCIERILGCLYELEKIFSLLSKKKISNLNLHLNKELEQV